MHHQRKNAQVTHLKMFAPNQSYQRFKGLKEWHFGIFEGESVYLFDNLYKPEDLFGDRIVPFKGEAGQTS